MTGAFKKVQAGQSLRIPAEAYNAFIDAAQAEKNRQHDVDRDSSLDVRSSSIVKVRNQTGIAQSRFNVLAIDSPIIAPTTNLQQFKNSVAFNAVAPAVPMVNKRYVILAEPLAVGAIGRAVLYGATPTWLAVASESHQFATPLSGVTNFMVTTAANGPFRILWKEAGAGFKWAIVAAEPSAATPAIVFQLSSQLTPGIAQTAAATVVISSNSTDYPLGTSVTVYNTGLSKGLVGARGIAMLFNGVWWVYQLNQPTVMARFLFSGNTHSAGGSETFGEVASQIAIAHTNFTSLTPYPFGLVPTAAITNPSNLIAFAGDSGLCVWDVATEQYILTQVYPQLVRRFYFKLTGNWPNGLDQSYSQATCLYAEPSSSGGNLVTGSITLRDRWNVASNAKSGDIGLCQLNYKTGQFDIVEISHVFTVGRGKVSTAFSGMPSTFTVTDVVGFEGRAPVGTLLTVDNELGIESAIADVLLELRWNAVTGKFYALPPSGNGRVIPVKLVLYAGSQGTATTAASWIYELRDVDSDAVLATNVNPVAAPHKWVRPSVGQMRIATFGYAHYSGSQLVLGWINEVAEQQACQAEANAPIADFPTPQSPAIDSQSPFLENTSS